MAYIHPESAFNVLKDRMSKTVEEYFPVKGAKNTVVAHKVWVDDNKDIDDIRTQTDAKVKGRSWTVPIRADVSLVDNKTGKIKDRQTVNVGSIPKITRRYTYIVDGNEWQVANQLRLKSGVYTRIKENGELASQWNLAKGVEGRGFSMEFSPETKKMSIKYGGSSIGLYPILKTLGVSDDDIEKRWGKELLTANRAAKPENDIRKMYRAITGKAPTDLKEAQKKIIEAFDGTALRPDSTKITLGKPFNKVTGEALLTGSHKILKVSRQEDEPDDRDSLEFKDVYSTEDLLTERLSKDVRRKISGKLQTVVDKSNKVRTVVNPELFGGQIKRFFTNSVISERPEQLNPMGFLNGNRKTTIGGEHGIMSAHALTLEAQGVSNSHIGFIDSIQTPESERTGTILQMALGAKKDGNTLKIRAYNTKKQKYEEIDPYTALHSNLAFPDQYKWVGGQPVPREKEVKVSDREGNISVLVPGQVDYILESSKGMFDFSANMIPFLQNTQGTRAMMASKQAEQAVSLKHREEPLVQVKGGGNLTFEQAVGRFNSHSSPVSGKVEKVKDDGIIIRGKDGERYEVQLYDNFPLNENKSFLNSNPLVKKGDEVKKGQVVADSNFTKGGKFALGTSLKTAYMPYRGYNYEDGIVISESAAEKLTSQHLHREGVTAEKNVILDKKKFTAHTAGAYTKDQVKKLDDDAVIKVGETVEPGDLLVGQLKVEEITPEQKMLNLFFPKKSITPVKPRPITWEHDYPAKVVKVVKHGKQTNVYLRADSPAIIGDKIVGRSANKGIITAIIPDREMPQDKDGNHMEVLLNQTGIPSRMNLGQVLETAASKIAEKTGKPYVADNFDPDNKDYVRNMKAELKKHGLSDTEDLVDPKTNKKYEKVLTGKQYILKLHHVAEKKLQARSRDKYDVNLTPKGGGPTSGQSMDAMGLYALLAHGARHNIREMQTMKSDLNDDVWFALQNGEPIPPPKIPFVYKKFEGYLKGMGVDVTKDGNSLVLSPLTDDEVLKMSNGPIEDAGKAFKGTSRGRSIIPEKGGLFDPKVTGTTWPQGRLGDKWSHLPLAERMPTPIFEKPIRTLTGLKAKDFQGLLEGTKDVDGKTGAPVIVDLLKKVDVDKDLKTLEGKVKDLRGAKLDEANKKIKYLRALKKAELNPVEAYTSSMIPVLPPAMRPVSIMDNGNINYDDLNGLYKGIGKVNDQLRDFPKGLPEEERHKLVSSLYDGMRALALTGKTQYGRQLSGIASTLGGESGGKSPKEAFFQKNIIGRRQDMSARGTIVPEPSLALDEVGLPRKAAMEIYKPFVSANLVRMGYTPGEALDKIRTNSSIAIRALENVVKDRPVMMKRDPVLHKYGLQAFRPVLTEGRAIKVNPLVTSGFGGDFDGDTMSAFVPVSQQAVDETVKMMPSNNLFSPSTGLLMYTPRQEAMLGLYKLTETGKRTGKVYDTAADAARAVQKGEIAETDLIKIRELSKLSELEKLGAPAKETTVARLMLYQALPEDLRDEKLLTDKKTVLDKKTLHDLLSRVASEDLKSFSGTAGRYKDLGNFYSTGLSVGLDDFVADTRYRDLRLGRADKDAKSAKRRISNKARLEKELAKIYANAAKDISDRGKAQLDRSQNRMYDWIRSGARGNWNQFKQIVFGPTLVVDSKGEPVLTPINKSFSEGLDVGSYWASMHGARMGIIGRTKQTKDPGFMSKKMMNITMNQMVTSDDCGTAKGIALSINDRDALGRFTAKDVNLGSKVGKDKGVIPAGTLVDMDLINRLKNNKIREIPVRTPLKCAHGEGLCSKCYGLGPDGQVYPKGTNLGVIASQAMGEPMSQLSMSAFHEGSIVGAKSTTAGNQFKRIEQLLEFPKTLPGAATLSQSSGKVRKIEKDPAGGHNVYVEDKRHFVPSRRELTVRRGAEVKKGDALSTGPKNPLELLPLTNIGTVQRYITDEVKGVYDAVSPVKRRNIETFVRSLTNLSQVVDPGDHPEYLRGDLAPTSKIRSYNSVEGAKKPVKYHPVLRGTAVLSQDMHQDWLARMQATNLKKTVLDASAEGWKSMLHGTHPIPGMAYGKEFSDGTPEEPWLY